MQRKPEPAKRSERRANAERTEATQAALIAAARALFVDKGYAGTSTPDIAAAAQVTRGALYHHYADKADLLYAAAGQAADEVAAEIAQAGGTGATPLQALADGAERYFAAMAQHGRARLLLLDAPAVLSPERLRALSDRAGVAELLVGLRAALEAAPDSAVAPRTPGSVSEEVQLRVLAELLSAAFDRAALAIAEGALAAPYMAAMRALLASVVGQGAASWRNLD
ncbi:TetR/AcrR family transcriptional regulator [Ottowia sp. GY511]|uniref:TetR/AcrR family transcriptional regulator n=1 Tax=Ottowia flava TaxID=2675430 RepID=A0ABW4KX26_9BURK|nr:TetR/AcrR family transcriptional regulator [Ottowia sp. GY511]TXK31359.1 TetR/AcrR family transcriptional regulator [Ottowia sp. GY511]